MAYMVMAYVVMAYMVMAYLPGIHPEIHASMCPLASMSVRHVCTVHVCTRVCARVFMRAHICVCACISVSVRSSMASGRPCICIYAHPFVREFIGSSPYLCILGTVL